MKSGANTLYFIQDMNFVKHVMSVDVETITQIGEYQSVNMNQNGHSIGVLQTPSDGG